MVELDLLRIITQNWRLNSLIFNQSNNYKLLNALKFIKSRPTTGSLAANNKVDFADLYYFVQTFRQEIDNTITGSELFPREMLILKKSQISLSDDIYRLLAEYYKTAYNKKEIVTITKAASSKDKLEDMIIASPIIDQYARIQIGDEFFGSTMTPKYKNNSYILAKFIQDNGSIDIFPEN
ncbi:19505_t:CDS:1, partial [Racocetra fulgida]